MNASNYKKLQATIVFIAIVAICFGFCLHYKKPVCILYSTRNLNEADYAGDWIGFALSDQVFFRLHLDSNGFGRLALAGPESGVYNYSITNFFVKTNFFICLFEQTGNENEPSGLIGSMVSYQNISAKLHGDGHGGWTEEIRFKKESTVITNFLKLKLDLTRQP